MIRRALAVAGLRILVLVASVGLVPNVAWACSSCNDPKDLGQDAFLGPTIFMSLLPLGMLGAIGGYLWWHFRRASLTAAVELSSSPSP